jgi:hypothetical protein
VRNRVFPYASKFAGNGMLCQRKHFRSPRPATRGAGGGPTSRSDAGQRMPSIRRTDRRCALTHGRRSGLASLSKVSVPVVRAAVLSAYNLAGSARWKDWGVVHILEVGALTVDFLLTGLANLGDGNGCAHHCEYRKPSASRGQKCSDGSRCWARITTLYAAREPHISG